MLHVQNSQTAARIEARLAARTARVGVIGLGYTGLAIARAVAEGGFAVHGFDVDGSKRERLANGDAVASTSTSEREAVAALRRSGRFEVEHAESRLADMDVVLICVPTPLDEERRPYLEPVKHAARAVGRHLRAGQLVVLQSTTFPGTTRDVLAPLIEREAAARGVAARCGQDWFLAYSPEREDLGRDARTADIPRLVGAVDDRSLRMAELFFGGVLTSVVSVARAEIAEAAKLVENTYRAVNIALVNELNVAFEAMGLDARDVLAAADTKPFGFQRFDPGPGLGGDCLPKDPLILASCAAEHGVALRLVDAADAVNRAIPAHVVERTLAAIESPADVAPRILVVGVAYKADVDDVRGSPGLELVRLFGKAGAQVLYHDPHVAQVAATAWAGGRELHGVALDEAVVAEQDAVVIATAHAAVDHERLAKLARLVVDTRGVLCGVEGNVLQG